MPSAPLPTAEDGDGARDLYAMADLVTPMTVRVAATLRIADHITRGLQTAPELAEAAHAHGDTLDRVLRHLVTAGVLRRGANGRYELTARGDALRDDHPSRLRGRLDIERQLGRAELSFVQLLHSVRTGEPSFPAQFGRSFWEDVASDEARSVSYNAQMGEDVTAWAPAIVSAYDWGSLGHVIDVGGGDGSLAIALLTRHPALRGTVLDLPAPVETARTRLAAAGLAERCDAVASSFFDPLPPGAGGYLLTAIVHNWEDGSARAILQRCAEAAGTAGKVFVIEKIGADGVTANAEMDLRMLAYLGGRERSLDELTALSEDAGLTVTAVHSAGAIAIVELAPVS
jgi:hypothetical protein